MIINRPAEGSRYEPEEQRALLDDHARRTAAALMAARREAAGRLAASMAADLCRGRYPILHGRERDVAEMLAAYLEERCA